MIHGDRYVQFTAYERSVLGESACHLLVFLLAVTPVITVVVERRFLIHVAYNLPDSVEIDAVVEHR